MRCTSRGTGYRLAWISRESPGDDLIALVIASAAVHCIWAILFIIPMDPWMGLLVALLYIGRSHMLAAYSVLGITTARYS